MTRERKLEEGDAYTPEGEYRLRRWYKGKVIGWKICPPGDPDYVAPDIEPSADWKVGADCNCLRCVEARGYEAGSAADPRSVLNQIDDPRVAGRPYLSVQVDKPSRAKALFGENGPPIQDRIGDATARKATPLFSGCINYFPDALLAVAELSKIGNEQHNPGSALGWDRSKSGDEKDALARHLVDAGTLDVDGVRHSAKVAWRALANLQKEIEAERG